MLAEIGAVSGQGLRLGIAHVESLRFMMERRRPPLCDPVRELIHDGVVDFVHLDDDVTADLVIVRDPTILQFPPAGHSNWDASMMWIVANQAPADRDGARRRYLVEDCTENARALFGCDPIWVPQSPVIRSMLESVVPAVWLADFDDPAIIDVRDWAVERPAVTEGPVPIGRWSADEAMKFPESGEDLLAVYPESDDIEVRMMGGFRVIPSLLGEQAKPANWTVLRRGAVSLHEFLAGIAYYVYFDNPNGVEAFGRSILEAIASGAVAILPDRYEKTFGEAALYAEPDRATGLVRELHRDPRRHADQVARSHAVVEDSFSPRRFVERVAPFLRRVSA